MLFVNSWSLCYGISSLILYGRWLGLVQVGWGKMHYEINGSQIRPDKTYDAVSGVLCNLKSPRVLFKEVMVVSRRDLGDSIIIQSNALQ